ncbi:MAG: hypothetical protein IKS21_05055 [Oscillospiraceae bacterium]|nr:hypothetical protein [Oscillospiraceae bacterium]
MIRVTPWGAFRDSQPPVGAFRDPRYLVGVGVLDDPVRRIVPLARCVGDAAPYGGGKTGHAHSAADPFYTARALRAETHGAL